jgi:putative ABC transport system permease protein
MTAAVPRRLALRNTVRRKRETILVVLGALLGTAIITGSLLVGASLNASIRADIPDGLGPVDLVVRASPEGADDARNALAGFTAPGLEGIVDASVLQGAVASPDGARVAPRVQLIEVDFAAAARLGTGAEVTGMWGSSPTWGEAVAGQELANQLHVQVGDRLEVSAYGQTVQVTVIRVLPRTGIAGWGRDGLNLFVSPGTLTTLQRTGGANAMTLSAPERLLLVSVVGDVFDSLTETEAVAERLEEALAGLPGVEVERIKQLWLDEADEAATTFGELFLAIGSFAVLAGILLLVNIFVMLAEERKRELGMLRAVGLERRGLIATFAFEGAAYALAAALFGAAAGIAVGRVIIAVTTGIFSSFDDNLRLVFTADPLSIATGFAAGLAISLLTVLATSVRISRINIIRAVRELPEPPRRHRRWTVLPTALAAVGFGVVSIAAVAAGDPSGAVLYPALLGVSLSALLARLLPHRVVVSAASGAVLVWALAADRFVDFADADIATFVVQGVVLVFSAVALLSHNQEVVGAAIRRVAGAGRATVRLGLAYPLARRFRTAMTLAMYSLVVFTLTFLAVLSQVFAHGVDGMTANEAGGFDLLATTTPAGAVPAAELEAVDGVAAAAVVSYAFVEFAAPGRPEPGRWALSGVDETFVAAGPPPLETWDRTQPSELAVWQALLDDPNLVIVDGYFLQSGGPQAHAARVGDTVTIRDLAGGGSVERTVIGIMHGGLSFPGAMLSAASMTEVTSIAAPNRFYLRLEPDADAAEVASALQREFLTSGMVADPFRRLVERNVEANVQFFRLMQGFLALGLLIGIAGLGVVMVRAVRERRREIGMLRSLGLQPRAVRSVFLLESAFVAVEGILLGVALALVTAYQVVTNAAAFGDFGVAFTVPWSQLAVLVAITALGSLAATAAPARQAARIRPAVALRTAD